MHDIFLGVLQREGLITPSNDRMKMSVKPSKYVCVDCGRAYKAAETLNRHRKNHSATTNYACDICPASFKRKDLLDRHYNIHAGGKQPSSSNRSQRACDRCSRLKTRCDNLVPCTRCTRGGHACTYMLKGSRARTDQSSRTSIDSGMSARSHDSPAPSEGTPALSDGTPAMSPNLHTTLESGRRFELEESWMGPPWLEESTWQWPAPEAQAGPTVQQDPIPSNYEIAAMQPWQGNLAPALMSQYMLVPSQMYDAEPYASSAASLAYLTASLDSPVPAPMAISQCSMGNASIPTGGNCSQSAPALLASWTYDMNVSGVP